MQLSSHTEIRNDGSSGLEWQVKNALWAHCVKPLDAKIHRENDLS